MTAIIDHDGGDEDRRVADDRCCPFCGQPLRLRIWRTPVFGPVRLDPFTDATDARSLMNAEIDFEDLITCVDETCKADARNFASRQRQFPEEKRAKARIEWQRRRFA